MIVGTSVFRFRGGGVWRKVRMSDIRGVDL